MKKPRRTYFDCLWLLARLRAGQLNHNACPIVLEHRLLWRIQYFVGSN